MTHGFISSSSYLGARRALIMDAVKGEFYVVA
jgi:hypothetical protein